MTDDAPAQDSAYLIDSRALRAGREQAFAEWADRVDALARRTDGHDGSLRLGQTEGLQHLVHRFGTGAQAEAFRSSEAYRALAEEAEDFSVGLSQIRPGNPARFDLPSDSSAAKWKRFVTTWIAVFPILLTISTAVRLLLKGVPQPVQLLFSSLLLTSALQWIILPRIQRWSRFWLLKNANGELRKG